MNWQEHALMLGGMLGFGLLLWSFFRRPARIDPKIVDFTARRRRALKAAQQVISR